MEAQVLGTVRALLLAGEPRHTNDTSLKIGRF